MEKGKGNTAVFILGAMLDGACCCLAAMIFFSCKIIVPIADWLIENNRWINFVMAGAFIWLLSSVGTVFGCVLLDPKGWGPISVVSFGLFLGLIYDKMTIR